MNILPVDIIGHNSAIKHTYKEKNTPKKKNTQSISFLSCIYEAIIIQSTLVISKSKGPSEILRDIRTSTY